MTSITKREMTFDEIKQIFYQLGKAGLCPRNAKPELMLLHPDSIKEEVLKQLSHDDLKNDNIIVDYRIIYHDIIEQMNIAKIRETYLAGIESYIAGEEPARFPYSYSSSYDGFSHVSIVFMKTTINQDEVYLATNSTALEVHEIKKINQSYYQGLHENIVDKVAVIVADMESKAQAVNNSRR